MLYILMKMFVKAIIDAGNKVDSPREAQFRK